MAQRLVDANKLIEKAYWHGDTPTYGKPYPKGHDAVDVEDIENSPTIDAVQVVRCKDCVHRDPEDKKCDCGSLARSGCPFPVDDNYFCGYGERKEGDHDCAEKMLDIDFSNIYQVSTESMMAFQEAFDEIKAIALKNGITVNEAIRKWNVMIRTKVSNKHA